MDKFLRQILLFVIPSMVFVLTYIFLDPFRVIGPIADERAHFIASSDDYYGVERYLKNKELGYEYNTFLFGNSKVMAYQEEAICANDSDCKFYNFGAPGESLVNILKKIELIQSKGDTIKKAFIILDHKILMNERNRHPSFQGPVYEHHPLVSDNTWISFELSFMQYFLKDLFVISYLEYKLTDDWKPRMIKHFKDPKEFDPNPYNSRNNQVSNLKKNSILKSDLPLAKLKIKFPKLSKAQKNRLTKIQHMLSAERSDLKIIFGPLRVKGEFPEDTENFFRTLFGKESVLNAVDMKFGKNDLWYDESHYSNEVGTMLIDLSLSPK